MPLYTVPIAAAAAGAVAEASRRLHRWHSTKSSSGSEEAAPNGEEQHHGEAAESSRSQAAPGNGHATACTPNDPDCAVPSGLQGRYTPEQLLSWPQDVWGGYESEDSEDDSGALAILPFDAFAACRLLDTCPDDALEFGDMFEALRTVAAFYLRADQQGICNTLQAYGVSEMLYDIACAKTALLSGTHCQASEGMADAVPPDQNMSHTEREEVIALSGKLMRQLECLLHEYLSFNWNQPEDVMRANDQILRGDGPVAEFTPLLPERQDSDASTISLEASASPHAQAQENGLLQRQLPGSSILGGVPAAAAVQGQNDNVNKSGGGGGSNGAKAGDADGANGAAEDALQRAGSADSSTSARTPGPSRGREGSLRTPSGRLFAADGLRRSSLGSSDSEPSRSNSLSSQLSGNLSQLAGSNSYKKMGSMSSTRSSNGSRKQDRASARAKRNWHRAHVVVSRKITTDMLGTQRQFRTMYEIFSDLKRSCEEEARSGAGPRRPVCLFLGGGMAAGKSTVREIIGKDVFWSKVATNAVVVEADAIKNRDVVYQQLSRSLKNSPSSADLAAEVHEFSTAAAESMFVTAINRQQDVIFDGTMMWTPFVEQCIAMVRDHKHNYTRGPGYEKHSDGSITEEYWKKDEDVDIDTSRKVPYRVEIVGVTCDPGLAVARGIWRQIRTKRGVPISSQLRSHKLFSSHFEQIAKLADSVTLYHTGSELTSFSKSGERPDPKIIAHCSNATRGELLVNPASYARFKHKAHINVKASSRADLYDAAGPHEDRVCRSNAEELAPLRHAFRAAETLKAGHPLPPTKEDA